MAGPFHAVVDVVFTDTAKETGPRTITAVLIHSIEACPAIQTGADKTVVDVFPTKRTGKARIGAHTIKAFQAIDTDTTVTASTNTAVIYILSAIGALEASSRTIT